MPKDTNMKKQKARASSAPYKKPVNRQISGKGDYKTALKGITSKIDGLMKRIPKGSASRFGGMLGGPLGANIGAGLSAITGYGDYEVGEVQQNSLSTVSTSVDMVPQFVKTDHSLRVTHREFIRDLLVPTTPAAFTNTATNINPANSALFPWLSNMATLYSQYKIHGMVFTYKSMSTNFSTGGPLGTVIMATNYNVLDKPFDNKIQMENTEFSVSCNPSQSLIHAIECDPKLSGLQTLYVRDPSSETIGAVQDSRFYDFGLFQVATTGLPGTTNAVMGELWVSYDIEFFKPVIGSISKGISLLSHASGALSVDTFAKVASFEITDTISFPQTSAFYLKLNPQRAQTDFAVVGDLPLFRSSDYPTGFVELRQEAGTTSPDSLRFYRSGTYEISMFTTAGVTASVNELGPTDGGGVAPQYVQTSSASGGATVALRDLPNGNVWRLPNRYFTNQVIPTEGYYNRITYIVDVLVPIETPANYVTVGLPFFRTAAANTGFANRKLRVSWTRYGTNSQSAQFVPLP